jgi:hypothetical protein
MPKTMWILTEERPKKEVVSQILKKFSEEQGVLASFDSLRIIPILDESSNFISEYKILGVKSPTIENIYLSIISGSSSFVDYLVYFQDSKPDPKERPLYAIEETKTDDSESRNTGVFQRATKFVYLEVFHPGVDKTMLYNLQIDQKDKPTETNIFGTRCFRTLGVQFMGKKDNTASLSGWSSIHELIEFKAQMKKAHSGNVPIVIKQVSNELISISGKLYKKGPKKKDGTYSGGLTNDPNIGALSLIAATLRNLGWTKRIQIVKHGLTEEMVRPKNKFVQIANHLNIELDGINLPGAYLPGKYWEYETTGEKLGSIFIHLVVEEFSEGFSIYENHAGCERGYFYTADRKPLAVGKRLSNKDGVMLKNAEKIAIPDLVIFDSKRSEMINIEGERSVNVDAGIKQIANFSNMEKTYIKHYYPKCKVIRTVVLYGGDGKSIENDEVGFLLNSSGKMVLGKNAPKVFEEAIQNLIKFWQLAS